MGILLCLSTLRLFGPLRNQLCQVFSGTAVKGFKFDPLTTELARD